MKGQVKSIARLSARICQTKVPLAPRFLLLLTLKVRVQLELSYSFTNSDDSPHSMINFCDTTSFAVPNQFGRLTLQFRRLDFEDY